MTLVVGVAHKIMVTWISLVAQVTWMMTLVAGVNRLTLVALVAWTGRVVLFTMAILAIDDVRLLGTSYRGFTVS